MQVIYERCCGLDVHKRTITGCVLKWLRGAWRKEIRQFGTTTKDLLALSDWLVREGCTHVACLDQLDGKTCFHHPGMRPLRQRSGLQTNALHRHAVRAEPGDQCTRLAEDLCFSDDPAIRIHHAHTRVFQ